MTEPVYVVGDVHGQLEKLVGLLRAAGLISHGLCWCGGAAQLWFLGDFFDRGPDGIGVVDLVMRLQTEAAAAGGQVGALLGNYEVLFLSAYHFDDQSTTGPSGNFLADWQHNGGQATDMQRLTPPHIAWLTNLPSMALVDDRLLMHADATFYLNYALTIAGVNTAFRTLLQSNNPTVWDRLLDETSEHAAFGGEHSGGADDAAQMLSIFGGQQIIHGHSPIPNVRRMRPQDVVAPWVYADGLCVNVDGGMTLGGPGFVYKLPPLEGMKPQHLRRGRRPWLT